MLNKKDKQRFIEELRKTPVIQVACQKANVGRSTYYRWCKEDKEFAKQASEALMEGRMVVNDLGEAQIIALMKQQNMHSIRFWMTHNDPRYSNKLEIKGQLIQATEELTPEQTAALRKALQLAMPTHDVTNNTNRTGADDQGEEL